MNPSKIEALANFQVKIEELKSQCITLNLSLNPEKIYWMLAGCNLDLRPSRALTFLGRVISSSMTVAENCKDNLSRSKKARKFLQKLCKIESRIC